MGKITIIGAGNGGCTYAAYLGKRGHEVALYEVPELGDNLADIERLGGLEMRGCDTGFGPVSKCTTDIGEACAWSEYILVVTPAFAHRIIARLAAPYLTSGQTVVLNPGSVFGAVEFLNILRECGNTADVTVGETSSNVFACRRYRPNDVNILGIKDNMHLACIPADRTEKTVRDLQAFFPQYIAVPNIFYTSFLDINAYVHPINAILNAGRIELTKGAFDFYWGGISPGVCANMEAIDKERLALAEALGYPMETLNELIHGYYGHPEWPSLFDFFSHSKVHGGTPEAKAPATMRHRYVTEDVPFGLVPIAELADVAGVPTPHIDAVITLASTFNGENYRETGRSLKYLGFGGKTLDQIRTFVLEGK